MFQAIIEDRNAPKVEKSIDGYSGFLFYDDNGMPLVAMHWQVRLAAHVSNGLKSQIRPVVGRIQPKARVSRATSNLKEAGCEEHTNSRANLWSDEQKSHMRSCMWVRQQPMLKPNNYTESCMINEADGWRGRNVWYLGRYVRYALKEDGGQSPPPTRSPIQSYGWADTMTSTGCRYQTLRLMCVDTPIARIWQNRE